MRLVEHLTALCAWCTRCLPGRWEPDMLRPINMVGMRGSMVLILRLCMKRVHSEPPPPIYCCFVFPPLAMDLRNSVIVLGKWTDTISKGTLSPKTCVQWKVGQYTVIFPHTWRAVCLFFHAGGGRRSGVFESASAQRCSCRNNDKHQPFPCGIGYRISDIQPC